MAGTSYTRQSTMSDGDTITAALFNNEFNQLLNAFSYASSGTTGHQHDGGAGEGGNIEVIGDGDFLNKIVVDSTNNRWGFFVQVSSSAVEQIRVQDGAIVPVTDNDIDLGTSSLEFKDGYFDGTVYADAINFNGTAISATAAELNIMDGVTATASELNILDGVTSTATELNIVDGNTSATSTTLADADRVVVNDNGTMVQVALTDFETYFESALDTLSNVTTVGTLGSGAISSGFGNIDIGSSNLTATGTISLGATSFNDQNITNVGSIQLDSIAGDGDTNTSLTFSGSDVITIATGGTTALTIDASQNVTVAGDLTVTGDDITMGTNTAGNLLIADGTNFNSIAVGSLSEISTVADDDVFLAVDTSGGGLKKITRSAVVSGLATSSAISNVADDSTPQLGGNLDMNGADIVTTSNADLELAPNGTGHVTVRGNDNAGAIQFNCESNSHGQIVKAQPHSAGVTNELLLPDGANSTLVSLVATQTLTNKTLTSPKINEDVAVTATATEINLIDGGASIGTTAIADGDGIIHNDGGTMKVTSAATFKTYFQTGISSAADDITTGDAAVTIATSSGNITIDAQASDSDIILKGTDGGADTTFLTIDGSAAGAASFNSDVTVGALFKMPDVTSAKILVADGTSYQEVAVSGDVSIASSGAVTIGASAVENSMLAGSIADSKLDTISTAGKVDIGALEIDGATDIGADLADTDLLIVDDGANGTERKTAMSRVQTYIEGKISGDITISSGTAAIGSGVIVNADINSSAAIADSKLAAISTAGKVALSALEIDGGTDIGADLTTSDLIIVDDGAGGTNRKAALSRLTTFMTGQGFSTDDPTALAIALG